MRLTAYHILLTLANEDKPTCVEDIDNIICAELPDNVSDPLAFETVTWHMIHSPCGNGVSYATCMMVVIAQNII